MIQLLGIVGISFILFQGNLEVGKYKCDWTDWKNEEVKYEVEHGKIINGVQNEHSKKQFKYNVCNVNVHGKFALYKALVMPSILGF